MQHPRAMATRTIMKIEVNPYTKYLERRMGAVARKKIDNVHEIVSLFHRLKGTDNKPKAFYHGRYGYGKLAREAKDLLYACDNNLEDAMWALDKMKYKAEKGGFDWSIITCLKHNLLYDSKRV